jgi:hypothetical protein
MNDRLTEIRRCYEMEMNVEKNYGSKNIKGTPSPLHIIIHQKQLGNVECFHYVGSMITNDASCAREIKSRIAMQK